MDVDQCVAVLAKKLLLAKAPYEVDAFCRGILTVCKTANCVPSPILIEQLKSVVRAKMETSEAFGVNVLCGTLNTLNVWSRVPRTVYSPSCAVFAPPRLLLPPPSYDDSIKDSSDVKGNNSDVKGNGDTKGGSGVKGRRVVALKRVFFCFPK